MNKYLSGVAALLLVVVFSVIGTTQSAGALADHPSRCSMKWPQGTITLSIDQYARVRLNPTRINIDSLDRIVASYTTDGHTMATGKSTKQYRLSPTDAWHNWSSKSCVVDNL